MRELADGFVQGPMSILCREIGIPFDRRLERFDVFMAFIRELVSEVSHIRQVQVSVAEHMGGKAPSPASERALEGARAMLAATTPEAAIKAAADLHDICDELNPDDAYPTDHLIDMVSSCASAVRFGLEGQPCQSRHAAEAANHVWRQVYGVSRHDRCTGPWQNDWARTKLVDALISLLPAAPVAVEAAA